MRKDSVAALMSNSNWLPNITDSEERSRAASIWISRNPKSKSSKKAAYAEIAESIEQLRESKFPARLRTDDLIRAIVEGNLDELHPRDFALAERSTKSFNLEFDDKEIELEARNIWIQTWFAAETRDDSERDSKARDAASALLPRLTSKERHSLLLARVKSVEHLRNRIHPKDFSKLLKDKEIADQKRARRREQYRLRKVNEIAESYGAAPYLVSDLNGYGDVTGLKSGWIQLPLRLVRTAPVRHTIVVGFEGSERWGFRPKKEAVVPESWWDQKTARDKSRKSNKLSDAELSERREARELRLGRGGVRMLRGMSAGQIALRRLAVELSQCSNSFQLSSDANDCPLPNEFLQFGAFFPSWKKKRRIEFFCGPTNSGKTWHALNALAGSSRGVYLAPLRLLAIEGQEELQKRGRQCSLITGEE